MSMACRQCEQTAGGVMCAQSGVCGKTPEVAALQDLLVYALKGICFYGEKARDVGVVDDEVDKFVIEGLFETVTNVDFDAGRLANRIHQAYDVKEKIRKLFIEKNGSDVDDIPAAATWVSAGEEQNLIEQGRGEGVVVDGSVNEDVQSLREILLYGLKGMAAYADHAWILGYTDEIVNAMFHKGMAALINDGLTADDLVGLIMEFGQANLKCLELLDTAHTETFGTPEPTAVSLGIKKGPAIIVSGHDLLDLQILLEQVEGTDVQVYTHGEMLPAHAYPQLKKYPNLAGHFGTAWQNQQNEFDGIPAAVLMTTNCIQKPRDSYMKNIFTTGLVAWPGVEHVYFNDEGKKDFSHVIERAQLLGGFEKEQAGKEITVGFGHKAILSVADKVVGAVKEGALKHFFLIGGCDGAKPGRNYFTELAEQVPQDCAILTLACGKFRFNTLDFGDIGGIPRLLDCGQCNDAYSAIVVAAALAEAFDCGVNDLPLTMILSWYEQKAVCILLTLLSLGITNIKLGPSLPAFISPNVLNILVEKFQIGPITTPEADIAEALEGK